MAVEGLLVAVGGLEGANRGRAVYIEFAAVLSAVGLEWDEHQVVAALVLDRQEAFPEGAHALRVVLAPLGVDWKVEVSLFPFLYQSLPSVHRTHRSHLRIPRPLPLWPPNVAPVGTEHHLYSTLFARALCKS